MADTEVFGALPEDFLLRDPAGQLVAMTSLVADVQDGCAADCFVDDIAKIAFFPATLRAVKKIGYYLLQSASWEGRLEGFAEAMRADFRDSDPDLQLSLLRLLASIPLQEVLSSPRCISAVTDIIKASCQSQIQEIRECGVQTVGIFIAQFEKVPNSVKAFCRDLCAMITDRCLDVSERVTHAAFGAIAQICKRLEQTVYSLSYLNIVRSLLRTLHRDRDIVRRRVLDFRWIVPFHALTPLFMTARLFEHDLNQLIAEVCVPYSHCASTLMSLEVVRCIAQSNVHHWYPAAFRILESCINRFEATFVQEDLLDILTDFLSVSSDLSTHHFGPTLFSHLPLFQFFANSALADMKRSVSSFLMNGKLPRLDQFEVEKIFTFLSQSPTEKHIIVLLQALVLAPQPEDAINKNAALIVGMYVRLRLQQLLQKKLALFYTSSASIQRHFAILVDRLCSLSADLAILEPLRLSPDDLKALWGQLQFWGTWVTKVLCYHLPAVSIEQKIGDELTRIARAFQKQCSGYSLDEFEAFIQTCAIVKIRLPSRAAEIQQRVVGKCFAKMVFPHPAYRSRLEQIARCDTMELLEPLFSRDQSAIFKPSRRWRRQIFVKFSEIQILTGASDLLQLEATYKVDYLARTIDCFFEARNMSSLVATDVVISCSSNNVGAMVVSPFPSAPTFVRKEFKAKESFKFRFSFLMTGPVETTVCFHPIVAFNVSPDAGEHVLPRDETPIDKFTIRCQPLEVSVLDSVTEYPREMEKSVFMSVWESLPHRMSLDAMLTGVDSLGSFVRDFNEKTPVTMVWTQHIAERGVFRAYGMSDTWGIGPVCVSIALYRLDGRPSDAKVSFVWKSTSVGFEEAFRDALKQWLEQYSRTLSGKVKTTVHYMTEFSVADSPLFLLQQSAH